MHEWCGVKSGKCFERHIVLWADLRAARSKFLAQCKTCDENCNTWMFYALLFGLVVLLRASGTLDRLLWSVQAATIHVQKSEAKRS